MIADDFNVYASEFGREKTRGQVLFEIFEELDVELGNMECVASELENWV